MKEDNVARIVYVLQEVTEEGYSAVWLAYEKSKCVVDILGEHPAVGNI